MHILFSFIHIQVLSESKPIHLQECTNITPTDVHQECTKSATTGGHQKCTYRCATRVHLNLIYVVPNTAVSNTPKGAHQECTHRCTPKAHLQVHCRSTPKRTYPSFSYLHLHQKRTYHCINVLMI